MSECNIARPGHRVEIMLDGSGPYYGTIAVCLPDACVVRLDNPYDAEDDVDRKVSVVAKNWPDVLLMAVQPDAEAVEAVKAPNGIPVLVRPGMRADVPVEGNGDRSGTIVYVMPELCVVKLDEESNYSGWYIAATWNRTTLIGLRAAPEAIGGKAVDHGA